MGRDRPISEEEPTSQYVLHTSVPKEILKNLTEAMKNHKFLIWEEICPPKMSFLHFGRFS